MSLDPVIGIDIGFSPAAVMAGGTWDMPFLIEVARFPRWDRRLFDTLREWKERFPKATMWRELTFTGKWKDIGRSQEQKATSLSAEFGWLYCCEPLQRFDPLIGWQKLGRHPLGEGDAGEHVRDASGVTMHGIIIDRTPGIELWDYTAEGWARRKREEREAQRRRPVRRAYR